MTTVDRANGTFTTQELERLTAYRAAIAAGFFTDWDGSAETADTHVLARLREAPAAMLPVAAYPFTTQERQRLEGCRAAVAAGVYSDDQPPAEASATPEPPAR
jgi:hypothetical protein